jgi:hypothetical protein
MHAADVPDQSDGDILAVYTFVKAYLHVFSKNDASGRVMATRVCACEVRTATCASLAGLIGHLLFHPAAKLPISPEKSPRDRRQHGDPGRLGGKSSVVKSGIRSGRTSKRSALFIRTAEFSIQK